MKTASKKAKGRRFQYLVCSWISKITGFEWGPTNSGDFPIQSREMGQCGSDIRLIGEVKEMFPFSVECKNQENWSIPAWIDQAKKNQEAGTDWILCITKNRYKNPLVVLEAETFFRIYQELLERKRRRCK